MFKKIILRDQVRQYLTDEMLRGKIAYGERLSLPAIAQKTGVSVTPIREALAQLEQAGVVNKIANRGFFVPPLSTAEAKEIYPIIISLETMGLRAQAPLSFTQIERLEQIQEKFKAAKSPAQAVKFDLQFHKSLLANFNNKLANRILDDLKVRVFFYELDYMGKSTSQHDSADGHQEIIAAIKDENIDYAVKQLQENWAVSLGFLEKYFT